MIINSIDCKNIGGRAALAIGFKPGVNVITGPNDSGKTTLKNSILYALTGTASNKTRQELYTTGIPNPKSEITMNISDKGKEHIIKRQLVPDPLVFFDGIKKKLNKAKDIDALFDVGFDRKTLRMICDNYNFFSLSNEEQQAILFKYFSGATDIDISKYGVTDSNEQIHFFGMTATNIPVYYKKFYDSRRDLNKEIELLEISKSTKLNEITALNVTSTVAELEAARTELTGKIKANIHTNAFGEQLNEYERILHEEEIKTFISRLNEKIAAINKTGLSNAETINRIKNTEGQCPLVPSVKCSSFADLKEHAIFLAETNDRLRKEVQSMIDEDKAAKLKFELEKQEKIEGIRAKIATIKASIEKERADNSITNQQINSENEATMNEIRNIDYKIQLWNRKSTLEKEISEIDADIAKKTKTVENYNIYLELTGDGEKSIKNKIVSGNIGDFFRMVTENSREFGYEFTQNPSSPEFEILINQKTSKMLSSSGEIKASLAIQVAISKVSGYNIVMADDVEKCEQGNITKIIGALTESGVQAFLFGHNLNKAIFPATVNFIELA